MSALTGWIAPIGAEETRSEVVIADAAHAVESFIGRDGARTLSKIIHAMFRNPVEVAQAIVSDCVTTCCAFVRVIESQPGATEITAIDVAEAIDAAGVIAAIHQHIVKRCVMQPVGTHSSLKAASSLALAEHDVCDAAFSLIGCMLNCGYTTTPFCEAGAAMVAHVISQLVKTELISADQIMQQRAKTLLARLSS